MTDAEIAAHRARLQAMLEDMDRQEEMGRERQATVVLDQQSVGRLSRMDALQQQAMARAHAGRRGQQAGRIRAALKRIETGEFGYCQSCGEEIGADRLKLDPTLPACVSCASG
jgi:DnaK suppressor protein